MSYWGETTLMPWSTYAKIMAIDPKHAYQCYDPAAPPLSDCDQYWLSEGYIDTAQRIIGRNQVLATIAVVEKMIADFLHFKIAPTWQTNEDVAWPDADESKSSSPLFYSKWGWALSRGVEAITAIDEDAAIVYSNAGGTATLDTATISISAAAMTAAGASWDEIAVYPPDQSGEQWRIRPLTITQATSGAVTIVGRRSQFVTSTLWLDDDGIDLTVNGNFLEAVDVMRRYNDDTDASEIVWKARSRTDSTTDIPAAGETTQDCALVVDDVRMGGMRALPATYAAGWTYDDFTLSRRPTLVRPDYYAGYYEAIQGWMEADHLRLGLAESIVRLTNSLMPARLCGCGLTLKRWEQDRLPLDKYKNSDIAIATTEAFGISTEGAAYALRFLQSLDQIW